MQHPLRPLCDQWLAKIEIGLRLKQERFGCYADEAYQFFNGPATFMFDEFQKSNVGMLGEKISMPMFRMSVNRLSEAVAIYGPAMVQQYPQINVEPVHVPMANPMDPMEQAKDRCAMYKAHYGNWLQVEGRKKEESRFAITEAIVKGMGVLWTEMHQPVGSQIKYPRSSFVSVDRLVVDPDATHHRGIQWIALKHVAPVHVVEQRFGLTPGSLKGHMQSTDQQTTMVGQQEAAKGKGQSFDLIEYWDVYSKAGFGERLQKSPVMKSDIDTSMFGDFCRIVVAKGCPYPLNLAPDSPAMQDPMSAVEWPIPFWMDGGWPYSELSFYRDTNSVWPVSLAKNGIGYLRFINWCISFLADKVAASSSTYIAMAKAYAKDMRDQMATQQGPLKILEIENAAGKSINEIVSILKSPDADYNAWKMIDEAGERFDKCTGLTDVLYAATGGMRTATEADVKQKNASIRPDDMAASTDDWLTEVARKEIQAMLWSCGPEDVAPIIGEQATYDLFQYMAMTPPDAIARDFTFRLAAESVRRPSKAAKRKDLVELGQTMMPVIMQFCTLGMTGPYNAYVSDLAKTYDIDPMPYMVMPFLPPDQQQPEEEEEDAPPPEPGRATDDALGA